MNNEYGFQTRKIERPLWICPLMCGCAVRRHIEIISTDPDEFTLYLLKHPEFTSEQLDALEEGAKTTVTETAEAIENQCEQHKEFKTPQALFDALKKYGGNLHSPDTCGCSIHFYYDKTVENIEPIHNHHPALSKRCPAHAHLDRGEEHFTVVRDENIFKNTILAAIAKATPELADEIRDSEGFLRGHTFKEGHEPKWHYDENRVLVINAEKIINKDWVKAALSPHGSKVKLV